ncbi:hypothetical protein [Campylobacter curvus]|uniref:hypothetical protein n=1 Tax=Campylobacter curvus TaxID=200 RepID=UPI00146FF550|nr:hypothetical protein [Campylobacter curvus]
MEYIKQAQNATKRAKRIRFSLPPAINASVKRLTRKNKVSYTAFLRIAMDEFLSEAKRENIFFSTL